MVYVYSMIIWRYLLMVYFASGGASSYCSSQKVVELDRWTAPAIETCLWLWIYYNYMYRNFRHSAKCSDVRGLFTFILIQFYCTTGSRGKELQFYFKMAQELWRVLIHCRGGCTQRRCCTCRWHNAHPMWLRSSVESSPIDLEVPEMLISCRKVIECTGSQLSSCKNEQLKA